MLPEKETPVRFDPNRRLSLPCQNGGTLGAALRVYMPGQGGVPDFGTAPRPLKANFCRRLPV
jgi:hypothetical protein